MVSGWPLDLSSSGSWFTDKSGWTVPSSMPKFGEYGMDTDLGIDYGDSSGGGSGPGKWSQAAQLGAKFLEGAGWRRAFYENPEMTAEAIGATTAAAPLIAGGAFLSAFAQGEKPRSAYAAPVEPTRGSYDETGGIAASSNSYNPSVESARAAAQYRHDLEEQKQRHKIELMQMRGESQTPGVQGGSGGSSDPLLAGMLQQIYSPSNRPKYF